MCCWHYCKYLFYILHSIICIHPYLCCNDCCCCCYCFGCMRIKSSACKLTSSLLCCCDLLFSSYLFLAVFYFSCCFDICDLNGDEMLMWCLFLVDVMFVSCWCCFQSAVELISHQILSFWTNIFSPIFNFSLFLLYCDRSYPGCKFTLLDGYSFFSFLLCFICFPCFFMSLLFWLFVCGKCVEFVTIVIIELLAICNQCLIY